MISNRFTPVFTLALGAAVLAAPLLSASAKTLLKAPVKPSVKAPHKAPVKAAPKPLPEMAEMTMNRARAGTGQLKVGTGAFSISSATLVLVPRTRGVEVALDTPRGRLWMSGKATTASGDSVTFSLTHASGSLAQALKLPARMAGTVTGRAALAPGRRTFSAISLDGLLDKQTLSASFRSSALPVKKH